MDAQVISPMKAAAGLIAASIPIADAPYPMLTKKAIMNLIRIMLENAEHAYSSLNAHILTMIGDGVHVLCSKTVQ